MSPWAYPAHHRAVGYSFNATKVMQNSDGPVYAEYAWPLRSSSQPLPFFSEFGSPPFRSHRLLQWRNTSQSLLHYMGPDLADFVAKVFWSLPTRGMPENDSCQAWSSEVGFYGRAGRLRRGFYQRGHLSDVGATFTTKSAQGGHAGLGSAPVSCRRPYRQPQRSSISRGSIRQGIE